MPRLFNNDFVVTRMSWFTSFSEINLCARSCLLPSCASVLLSNKISSLKGIAFSSEHGRIFPQRINRVAAALEMRQLRLLRILQVEGVSTIVVWPTTVFVLTVDSRVHCNCLFPIVNLGLVDQRLRRNKPVCLLGCEFLLPIDHVP